MQIQFKRTGGFTGLRMATAIDTRTISAAESEKVLAMIESAQFFTLPEKPQRSEKGADRYTYSITITDGGKTHTVDLGERAVPVTLRPLIGYLTSAAKK